MIVLCSGVRCEVSESITCGVVYTVPEVVMDQQRKAGGYHYCPNGHQQGWGKGETENDKIRRERDLLIQRIAQKDDELRDKERLLADERKKAAKVKKRSAHGICPCCNRTVSQMARHMKSKHPDFIVSAIN